MDIKALEEQIRKQRELFGKGKDNGVSQPAADIKAASLPPIASDVNTGVSEPDSGRSDTDSGKSKSVIVSGLNTNRNTAAENSNTEISTGLQHASDLQDSNQQSLIPAAIPTLIIANTSMPKLTEKDIAIPQESLYCDDCNNDIADCTCNGEDTETEEEILASIGIVKPAPAPIIPATNNGKELNTVLGDGAIEDKIIDAAEIVAKEYAISTDDLKVFYNIFNQTTEKVKDLLPDQLEQKIMHLDRVIGAIKTMQTACKRLASDKLSKETKKEKAERAEREKSYKVPRRRTADYDGVDATGAIKTKEIGKLTKRDKLIKDLMLAGLSKEKATAIADGGE
jgi:hypothetical protein